MAEQIKEREEMMSERNRLTRLIGGFVFGTQIAVNSIEWNGAKVKELADYLIANGVIVTPCKVGDTVFILDDVSYGEYVITEFCIGTLQELRAFAKCGINGYKDIQDCPEHYCGQEFCSTSFSCKDFGKTVFLTREEAEKALKESDEG